MIYYIFYELIFGHSNQDWWVVKALNVFQYVTFRTAYASVTALLISLLFGRRVINALKRWNIGQQIREEGPQAHMAKQNTPTMGGLLVIAIGVWLTLYISTRYFETKYSWNVSIPFFKDTADPYGISTIGPIMYLF